MSVRPDYVALRMLSEQMHEAAKAECWSDLNLLRIKQEGMLSVLPPPSPSDQPHLEHALSELDAAMRLASTCQEQIGTLLSAFRDKIQSPPDA